MAAVLVSVGTARELEIKRQSGKLMLDQVERKGLARLSIDVLPINLLNALAAARLPPHHRDPFDGMIIAQATIRGLTVLTRDRSFDGYDVPILRA